MKAFIQKKNDGEYFNTECFSAFTGFSGLGYEIVPFVNGWAELDDLTRSDIVFGTVQTVRQAFQILKVQSPPNIDYPTELQSFLKREVKESLLGDFMQTLDFDDGFQPKFIKPSRAHKIFTGFVVREFKDLFPVSHLIKYDYHIYVCDVVDFVSEYRVFILEGEILACKHYYGSWEVFPDPTVIKAACAAYNTAPVAYSLDVGVTKQGETLLVEVNDFFALGSYGLDPIDYARCIEARWRQIMEN